MEQDFNYFLEQMQEYYTQLTGIPVQDASDVGIRFRVLAQQLAGLQQELNQAQIQEDTNKCECLEEVQIIMLLTVLKYGKNY